jgi:hypothetical protein
MCYPCHNVCFPATLQFTGYPPKMGPLMRVSLALMSILLFAVSLVGTDAPRKKEGEQFPPSVFIPIFYYFAIFAEVRVYGKHGEEVTGQFMLDTASELSSLDQKYTDVLGLKVTEQGNTHELGGDQVFQRAIVPKICLGNVCENLRKVNLVDTKAASPFGNKYPSIGLLGVNFFKGRVLTIDYQNQKVALTLQPLPMPGYRSVLKAPLNLVGGMGFVSCELPTLKQFDLMIDTGNTQGIILGKDLAKLVQLESVTKTEDVRSDAVQTHVKYGRVPWVEIAGQLKLSDVTIGLSEAEIHSPLNDKYGSGLMGNQILQNYVVQIQYPNKIIKFLQKQ